MTLGIRKVIVVSVVAAVLLLANLLVIARWLADAGVIDFARYVRSEYITGTAVTVVLVLLFLLVSPSGARLLRQCRVCDRALPRHGQYCPACGSRV